MSDHPKPFFFVHLQKTAGTSLIFALRDYFGREAVYPGSIDKGNVASVISVEHLQERWRTHGSRFRVVTGHFPLCTTELLGGDFTALTVLRDPVERTLSYLRHHRVLTPEDADLPLEAIYEDPFRFRGLVHNHMVKMFSLTVDEMTDGALTLVDFTSERLQRAKDRLEGVAVVGLQEDFDSFCGQLTQRFGWELGAARFSNRTEPVDVSDAFRARIARDNAMDIELYEFARRLVERRASGERAPLR